MWAECNKCGAKFNLENVYLEENGPCPNPGCVGIIFFNEEAIDD